MNWKLSHTNVKIGCFIISCLCYINSLWGDFCFDDISAIVENKDLRPGTPLLNLLQNDFWGTPMHIEGSHKSYRPLTIFTFRINYYFDGLQPISYHIVNVLLHGIVTYLFTSFVSEISDNCCIALISGLLFAIHPIHTEAIAGLVGRAESLSGIFFLLVLFIYSRASNHTGLIYCIEMVLLYLATLCSILSKEVGITVIAICCVYDALYTEKIVVLNFLLPTSPIVWFKKYSSILKRITHLLIFTLTILFLRIKINGPGLPSFTPLDNPANYSPFPTRQLSFLYLCFINTGLLFCPSFLCADWTMQTVPLIESPLDPRNILTLLTFSGYFMLGIWAISDNTYDKRLVLMALSIIIFPYIPASNLFFPVGFVIAERILYLPSMGMCLLVALGVNKLMKIRKVKYLCYLFLCITCLFYCTKTMVRNLDWSNDYSLFKSGIKINKHNAKLYNNLGHVFENREQYQEAEELFLKASGIQPDDTGSWINLGRVLKAQKRYNESELALKTALQQMPNITEKGQSFRIAPNFLNVYFNYANLLSQNPTRYKEAENYYKTTLRVRPDMPEAHMNYGNLLIKIGDFDSALSHFQMAIDKKPDYADAYYNMATTYLKKKDSATGEKNLRITLSLDPNHIHGLVNLANLLLEYDTLKSRDEAMLLFKRVLEIDPSNELALFSLGLLFSDDGLHQQAEEMFLQTVNVNPLHKSALFNLGFYALTFKNFVKCIEYLGILVANYPAHFRGIFNLADCYMHISDRENAKLYYKLTLELDPNFTPALHNLGVALAQENDFLEAIALFEQVLILEPSHQNAKIYLDLSKNELYGKSKH
ncbi:Transmembrane and TPR repeat-containing protein 3-like [Oopsacas minuta]|uniref:dolichyl-phosphate-mannose--protein mannosyltransferase n=1 Tax=Oopsacas minuta TaxID=111878 RepID=A0AAV7K2A6_9METZ|nr:Transmembrane and TPR repeat-containing protein 3-like [Oopsacas minuta]